MSTVEATTETEELSPEDRLAAVEERTNEDGTLTADVHEVKPVDGKIEYTFIHAGQTYTKTYDEPETLGDDSMHIDICKHLDLPLYSFDQIEGSAVPMVKKHGTIKVDSSKIETIPIYKRVANHVGVSPLFISLTAIPFPFAALFSFVEYATYTKYNSSLPLGISLVFHILLMGLGVFIANFDLTLYFFISLASHIFYVIVTEVLSDE